MMVVRLFLFFSILLWISCSSTRINESTTNNIDTFSVGFAQNVITPKDSAFIAGHSHNRRFKGVNDNIFVKAATIESNGNLVAILTFDCIGLLHPQLLQIRQKVKERIPLFPVENIVMTSTHTHSGPDVVGLWGKSLLQSGLDPKYMDNLVNSSANTLIDAYKSSQKCQAEYAQSSHGKEWVYNISEPEELDRSVIVLRFSHDDKNVLTLTNFACHPTFLDAVNDKVSSDYVGGYYKEMTEWQGGGNMFIQGSIGGWVQPEHEAKTPNQAFFRGSELAQKVKDILSSDSKPIKGNEVFVQTSIFNLPMENEGFAMLAKAGVVNRDFSDSVMTEVAYFKIGNASFATHPGETVPELSLRTKDLMNNDGPRFIMGLGMDALGYILKPYFFDEERAIPHSPYLCRVSVGPQTQEFIFKELKDLIQLDPKTLDE